MNKNGNKVADPFKMISILSLKGGVGKTTTSIHLGACLSARGPVAIVDGDRTRNATYLHSLGNLPTSVHSQTAIAKVANRYRYVVVDTRGGLDGEDLDELTEISDVIIIPSNAEAMSLDAMVQTTELLEAQGHLKKTFVLFTMTQEGKVLDSARVMIAKELGLSVLAATIRRTVAFSHATSARTLVGKIAGEVAEKAADDYQRVTNEILEFLGEGATV